MIKRKQISGGQALVMVTFALLAMIGLIGLAVDLGWSFFVKKQAQAAADAGATAAVEEALRRLEGSTFNFTCGQAGVECQAAPVDCGSVAADSNLRNGCLYAASNGFTTNGHFGRQNVTIQANVAPPPPPTAPGVNDVVYWVTVRAVERVPQLFSAVLGNTESLIASRATAGIVKTALPGSLYVLNQGGDCQGGKNCGVDLDLGGSSHITAAGPIIMASQCSGNGTGCKDEAGISNGAKAGATAPSILIQGTGTADSGYPGWTNGTTGKTFRDPTEGLVQPPLVATGPVKTCGIPNGQISASGNAVLGPYNYYAYTLVGGNITPTGAPITLNGNIRFSTTGICPGILSVTGGLQTGLFQDYFFYGGVTVNNGSNITFGPGQYVMVGSKTGTVFDISGGNTQVQSSGSGSSYAGNMFIFTAPGYPGVDLQINTIPQIGAAGNLLQGTTNFKTGSSGSITLNGFNSDTAGADPALDPYNGVLFWQDRRNSTVEYNADGTILNAPATASQMQQNLATASSPEMSIGSSPNLNFTGLIYQPRGSWIDIQASGEMATPLQIITGAIVMQGSGTITLDQPKIPFPRYVNALIE